MVADVESDADADEVSEGEKDSLEVVVRDSVEDFDDDGVPIVSVSVALDDDDLDSEGVSLNEYVHERLPE